MQPWLGLQHVGVKKVKKCYSTGDLSNVMAFHRDSPARFEDI